MRIPLTAFVSADPLFNLSAVASIRFDFNKKATGDLVFSDISLDDTVRVIVDPSNASKQALYIPGTTGADTIVLLKKGTAAGSVNVTINGVDQGTYRPSGQILVYGERGDDTLTLDFGNGQFIPPGGLTFDGGPGNNTLQINRSELFSNIDTTWAITGLNAGTASGGITFKNVENLTGGTGQDVFQFKPGGQLTGAINGNGAAIPSTTPPCRPPWPSI